MASKIICKRFYERTADGTPISYRTKYYRHYDGITGRASVGSKCDAVRMEPAFAETVCSQLNTIAGSGWTIVDPDAKPERDKKLPKAEAPQAAA